MLIRYLTYKMLYSCYCTRWFACNGYSEGHIYSLIWPIRGCAAVQSTVREQNLNTLAIIKRHLISTNPNIHPCIIRIRTPGQFKLSFLDLVTGRRLDRTRPGKIQNFTTNKQASPVANRRTTTETNTKSNQSLSNAIPLYVPNFIKLTWGHTLSRLAIWSIILS